MEDGGGNGATFRKMPVRFPINQTPRTTAATPSLAERTTCQYAQHNGTLFSQGCFPLGILFTAARFCDFEQT